MSQQNRRREPGRLDAGTLALFAAVGVAMAIVGVLWGAVSIGSAMAGVNPDLNSNPFVVVLDLFRARLTWPAESTVAAIALSVVVLVAAIGIGVLVGRLRRSSTRVDRSAAYLARGRDLDELSRRGAERTAARLGVKGAPGIPLGRCSRCGST
jgi:hypothetical protein